MPTDPLDPNEARSLLEAAAKVDFDAGAGRDFHYSLALRDGGAVSGLLVEQTEKDVTLADVSTEANAHQTVIWADVASLSVTGYV